jgi:hypothetical protein
MNTRNALRLSTAAALLAAAPLFTTPALAADCATPAYVERMTPAEKLVWRMRAHKVVFAGVPIESSTGKTTFKVVRVFRGSAPAELVVNDASGTGGYTADKTYMVFANPRDDGHAINDACLGKVELPGKPGRARYPEGFGKGWSPRG